MPREGPLVEDRVSGMQPFDWPLCRCKACCEAKRRPWSGNSLAAFTSIRCLWYEDGVLHIRFDGLPTDRAETTRA